MRNYELAVKALKVLCAEVVEHANSGHPGAALGMAEIAVKLWCDHLKHNPLHHQWFNRDRFILSNGHASVLQYVLLHLSGYQISIEDLKQFRQLHSNTPGHPEYRVTDGIETSTGPLGQGLANAVGMSLTEKLLSQEFNRPNFKIVDHYTYAFVGDGCLMEGISHEVSSLAGTLNLGKLIVFYDSNRISIDGNTNGWFTEDVEARYNAYNWHVITINGHDLEEIEYAIKQAKAEHTQPSLIICHTIIGNGAPNKQDSAICHGSPLGISELQLLKDNLNWHYSSFVIPDEVYEQFNTTVEFESKWDTLMLEYEKEYPELCQEFLRRMNREFAPDILKLQNQQWQNFVKKHSEKIYNKYQNIASRKASQIAINYYTQMIPEIFGSSADLTESNCANWDNYIPLTNHNNWTGNFLKGGVREFGLAAIANGMIIHGGYRVFTSTFLTFSDYARNALRMAALMQIPTIFLYTHDSIGVGEDGPTHQPIEHISSLRLIPNLHVWRPSDIQETIIAWNFALTSTKSPTALIFARQPTEFIKKDSRYEYGISKGGYIVSYGCDIPEIIIMATGTELEIAVKVANILNNEQKKTRVVSMVSTTVFDQQDENYKNMVLPKDSKLRVAIEAAQTDFWYKYIGLNGIVIGINSFGESATAKQLYQHFGLTPTKIAERILASPHLQPK